MVGEPQYRPSTSRRLGLLHAQCRGENASIEVALVKVAEGTLKVNGKKWSGSEWIAEIKTQKSKT